MSSSDPRLGATHGYVRVRRSGVPSHARGSLCGVQTAKGPDAEEIPVNIERAGVVNVCTFVTNGDVHWEWVMGIAGRTEARGAQAYEV